MWPCNSPSAPPSSWQSGKRGWTCATQQSRQQWEWANCAQDCVRKSCLCFVMQPTCIRRGASTATKKLSLVPSITRSLKQIGLKVARTEAPACSQKAPMLDMHMQGGLPISKHNACSSCGTQLSRHRDWITPPRV